MPERDDLMGLLFVDLVVAHDQLRARLLRIFDVLGRAAADDAVVERLDDFLADADVVHGDARRPCRSLPRAR
jgi:hypothetical protein